MIRDYKAVGSFRSFGNSVHLSTAFETPHQGGRSQKPPSFPPTLGIVDPETESSAHEGDCLEVQSLQLFGAAEEEEEEKDEGSQHPVL